MKNRTTTRMNPLAYKVSLGIAIALLFGLLVISAEFSPTGSIAAASYNTTVLPDKPLSFWTLDGGSLALTDLTGSGRNATAFGNPTTSILPNGEGATVFDGLTQYAEVADNDVLSVPTTGILTIEAWMRPDVLQFPSQQDSGYVNWLGKGVSGQHEYIARMYSFDNKENRPNRISGYAFNLSGGLGVGSYFQDAVTAGEWIHYTLVINTVNTSSTYPTGYTKIYKNGLARDQDSLSGLSIVPGNGTAPLRIATRDFASYFKGAIAKVAIYNYELSATQISNHYQAMTSPTAPPANSAPVATNDSATTNANTPVTIAVLANDTDVDGNPLTVTNLTQPANGIAVLNSNNTVTYTPNANFTGVDTFTYTANDGLINSNTATVSITVTSTNTPPVANPDTYTMPRRPTRTVAAPGVLGNDTDVDGNPLTAILASAPSLGKLTLNPDGSFTYASPGNFIGQVTFTYKANDGLADSNVVATVTITVTQQ